MGACAPFATADQTAQLSQLTPTSDDRFHGLDSAHGVIAARDGRACPLWAGESALGLPAPRPGGVAAWLLARGEQPVGSMGQSPKVPMQSPFRVPYTVNSLGGDIL
jgi:hypothetical protein